MNNIFKGFIEELQKHAGIWDQGIKTGIKALGSKAGQWTVKNPGKAMAIGAGGLAGAGALGRMSAPNPTQVNVNR